MTSQIKTLIINRVRAGDSISDICDSYGVTTTQINRLIPVKNSKTKEVTRKEKVNPIMVEAGKKAWITRRKMYGKTGINYEKR